VNISVVKAHKIRLSLKEAAALIGDVYGKNNKISKLLIEAEECIGALAPSGQVYEEPLQGVVWDLENTEDLSGEGKGVPGKFDLFWTEYPRKVGKQAAIRAWKKIKPDEGLFGIIISAVREQKNCKQWQQDGGQFIPNPATWLNQGRWDDEQQRAEKRANQERGYTDEDFEQLELERLRARVGNLR